MTGTMQDIICAVLLLLLVVGAIRWIYKVFRFLMVLLILGAGIYGLTYGFDAIAVQISQLVK